MDVVETSSIRKSLDPHQRMTSKLNNNTIAGGAFSDRISGVP